MKFLPLLSILSLASFHALAQGTRIQDLNAATTITADDLLIIADDPGGSISTKKATATVLETFLRTNTATLTNKTISLGSNTLSGTLAQLNALVNDADVVSLAGTETLTNKTLTSPAISTPSITGAITLASDTRQTFAPGANNAGVNVGGIAGDPASPTNGDLWYDSTANELTARINGANVALGAGGGGVSDGDKGDIVVSGSGAAWAIDPAVATSFAKTILDDTTAAGVRETIGAMSQSSPSGLDGLTISSSSPSALPIVLTNPSGGVSIFCEDVAGSLELLFDNMTAARVIRFPDASGTLLLSSGNGSSLTSLSASALATGTVPTARLGSGTADSTTYLRGDNTWQTITSGDTPAGSGTEIQIRANGTTLGAVTGSSSANGGISLAPAAGPALSVNGGTAATPAIVSSADTDTGLYWSSADTMAIATGGVLRATVGTSGGVGAITLHTPSGSAVYSASGGGAQLGTATINASLTPYWTVTAASGAFSSSNRAYPFSLGGDVTVAGDAADVFAHRRGTNAQEVRVYNTDGTSDEYLTLDWKTTPNLVRVGTVKTGTATARDLQLITDGTARITVKASGVVNIANMPTSSAGLSTGDLWNDSGTVKIVP